MIERFEKKMFKTGIRRQLVCEICVWPDDTPVGLNGCGLLVINPPWKFSEDADEALYGYSRICVCRKMAVMQQFVG